jgi:hypothetical protein
VLVSAELRWFWKNALPDGIEGWFRGGPVAPGGGTRRSDEYLVDRDQIELGVKTRGGRSGVEIKGLVAVRNSAPAPFDGRIQIWCKWTSAVLALDHLPRVAVHKTRWVRKYDTSGARLEEVALDSKEAPIDARSMERGCQVELADVRLESGGTWWSIGFESFGELATVEDSLRRTVVHLARTVPAFAPGYELSYPAWLSRHASGQSTT